MPYAGHGSPTNSLPRRLVGGEVVGEAQPTILTDWLTDCGFVACYVGVTQHRPLTTITERTRLSTGHVRTFFVAMPKVVPAQLSFLAIYNPSLGTSDETFDQQIVFYYSKAAKTRARLKNGDSQQEQQLRDEENEKLRQVGLAQGMVGFAK